MNLEESFEKGFIRIVKMEFSEDGYARFPAIFQEAAPKIAAFPGCLGVRLLRDKNDPARFFTYSLWADVGALEAYRNSELFRTTWARTKPLFRSKAEAWSVDNFQL